MFGSFFAQTFSNAVIVGNYYLNRTAYSENCENKDKPWMHCNGKCQMRKQIQQEEKKDQENPERRADSKADVVLSSKSFFANSDNILQITVLISKTTPLSIGTITSRGTDIFHPPQA